ncbi:MAG: hypothetical protein IPM55_19855 [Acidobacteria bacterium]|nr:hypothetical protein [Acidobacteriota bacterium]
MHGISKPSSYKLLLFWVFVALVLIISYGFIIYRSIGNWQDRSSFGEMFGAIDALFSGLALAGILYTIHIQRKEIHEAHEAVNDQIEIQLLTDELNALRHEIDILFYEIDLKSRLGMPSDSEDRKEFVRLKERLIEQYKLLDSKKSERAAKSASKNFLKEK